MGYLPLSENGAVAQMLEGNRPFTARIVGLRKVADPWERVRLAVECGGAAG